MIFEGREVKNNGCKKHRNCLTCPFEECFFVLADKEKTFDERAEMIKARHHEYYLKNKEKIKLKRLKREFNRNMSKLDGVTWIDNKSMTIIVDINERDKAIRREAFEEMLKELGDGVGAKRFKGWIEQKIQDIGA